MVKQNKLTCTDLTWRSKWIYDSTTIMHTSIMDRYSDEWTLKYQYARASALQLSVRSVHGSVFLETLVMNLVSWKVHSLLQNRDSRGSKISVLTLTTGFRMRLRLVVPFLWLVQDHQRSQWNACIRREDQNWCFKSLWHVPKMSSIFFFDLKF